MQHKAINESNPYHREIYGFGFDIIIEDIVSNKLILCREIDRSIKKTNLINYKHFISALKIIHATNFGGKYFNYISNVDGSLKKFKEYINNI